MSNMTLTTRFTLVSIAETNFSPTEFEIPSGYRDATGESVKPFRVDPSSFQRGIGRGKLDGLRKDYEKGKPLLDLPKR